MRAGSQDNNGVEWGALGHVTPGSPDIWYYQKPDVDGKKTGCVTALTLAYE